MHLYMIGRLKSICKFKEKQVADTSVTKRASAIVNIKPVQIQRLPQRHLHKQITPWYRYIRHQKSKYIIAPPISIMVHLKARKDYALQLSFVGQARLQFAGLHSLFLALWCIVIEIDGMMKDLLFWDLMYLHPGFICCRRCFFDNWCICTALIFIVADTFFETDVSATYFSLNLQMLFSLSIM